MVARPGRRPRGTTLGATSRIARPIAATTAVLTAALGLGLPLTATSSVAAPAASTAGEVVLPAAARAVPRATQILHAGTTGFLWAQEDDDRLLWTEYTTGTTTPLERRLPAPLQYDIETGYFQRVGWEGFGLTGNGSDTVALYSAEPSPHVTLIQGAGTSGGSVTVPLPAGHSYRGTFGDVVVTRTGDGGSLTGYHLWRAGPGGVTETAVTGLPADARDVTIEDGDARSIILKYRVGDGAEGSDVWPHWGMVDLVTGALTPLPDRIDPEEGWEVSGFRLGTDSLLRRRDGRMKADVYDRRDLSAQPRTFETGAFSYQASFGIVGSALLGVEPIWPGNNIYRGQPLWSLVPSGAQVLRTKVMDPAAHQLVQAPDGSVLVAGAERYVEQGDLDWGVYRITQAADGSISRSRLTTVQPVPARVYGLSLGSGILSRADDSTLYEPGTYIGVYRSTWLTTPSGGGTPAVERTTVDGLVSGNDGDCRPRDSAPPRCIRMFADGTGHHGRQKPTYPDLTMLFRNGATTWGPTIDTGDHSPELVDLSGRYAVINGAASGRQYVGEFRTGADGMVLQQRDRVAAAVWGSTLFSGAATGGTVTATRLPAGAAVDTFTTRNGCTPSSLQAVGRWVYWTCVDYWGTERGSGLYDRTTRRTATAPAGDILLGDGYLVERVLGTGADSGLRLYDLHGGLPSSGSHTDLPSRLLVGVAALGPDSRARAGWTVDRFGGSVAYADIEQRVHLVPTGVPASALTAIDSALTSTAASWSGTWWLSKPAAAWQVDVRRGTSGAVVRTLAGSTARGLLEANWDGRDSQGRLVANGTYTWTLTAQPADGQGAALVLSGATTVTAGTAAPRDHVGNDGVGDLLTFDGSGTLAVHRGTGTGTLGSAVSGSGWPTNTRFVPFGDLGGDGCNDVLVRLGTGELRAYRPACGAAATPATPYTSFGSVGWRRYDILTFPGDVDGDGRPDLIAYEALTGGVHLFKGTGAGTLSARTTVASGRTGLKQVVGAGDLNHDGRGDLLVVDASDALWRYDADPASPGGFKAGVKVSDGWGASYDAVVGVGDITGDGRADLVSRDTGGNLWRHDGNGSGSFGGPTRIATGWQGYRAVV